MPVVRQAPQRFVHDSLSHALVQLLIVQMVYYLTLRSALYSS